MNVSRRKFGSIGLVGAAAVMVAPVVVMEGCSSSWIATAEKDIPVIVNIAGTVVEIAGTLSGNPIVAPATAALIQAAAATFSVSVQGLSDAIAAYKASPSTTTLGKVVAALDAVQADAPKIIQSIPGIPPAEVSIITAGVGTAISLLAAIVSLLPASAVASSKTMAKAPVHVNMTVKLPDANQLKSNFNAVLSVYGYGRLQIQ